MSTAKTETMIRVNNQDVPLATQQILSISIIKEVNKIPTARIVIKDGMADQQAFPISDQDVFIPGASVEILFGTTEGKKTVFKGIVTKHSLKALKDQPSMLYVECRDETVRLTIGRKSRFYNDKTDKDIFEDIVKGYSQINLQTTSSAQGIQHDQIVQYYTTDWDFIAMRSEAIGCYLFVSDGVFRISAPELAQAPAFALCYGIAGDTKDRSRIWEFESEMEARNQFGTINTSSWDYSKQQVASSTPNFTAPSEPGNISSKDLAGVINLAQYPLHHLGFLDTTELTAYANAVKQKSILNKTRGRIKFDGRSDVLPGNMVALEGVGKRFNGNVFVSMVQHTFEPGRWYTHIQFGLPYSWYYENESIPNPPAQGLLPPITGLQVGKVVQLKNAQQPDKDFRIKVQIPGLHTNNEGVWARMANLQAGNKHGAIFLPELQDEVVIAYVDQDPREPVILGALYSESNAPIHQNDDNNYKKGIFTKNNQQILIDDEHNVITIKTKSNRTVEINDKNKTITLKDSGNTIELSDSGITIENKKSITIKTSDLKLEAKNISIKGDSLTSINSPVGGIVKLGNGVKPVSSAGDPVAGAVGAGAISPGANSKVLV